MLETVVGEDMQDKFPLPAGLLSGFTMNTSPLNSISNWSLAVQPEHLGSQVPKR